MDVLLYIDGRWQAGAAGRRLEVINPATEEVIGTVARAETADLDAAALGRAKGLCRLA